MHYSAYLERVDTRLCEESSNPDGLVKRDVDQASSQAPPGQRHKHQKAGTFCQRHDLSSTLDGSLAKEATTTGVLGKGQVVATGRLVMPNYADGDSISTATKQLLSSPPSAASGELLCIMIGCLTSSFALKPSEMLRTRSTVQDQQSGYNLNLRTTVDRFLTRGYWLPSSMMAVTASARRANVAVALSGA